MGFRFDKTGKEYWTNIAAVRNSDHPLARAMHTWKDRTWLANRLCFGYALSLPDEFKELQDDEKDPTGD